MAQFKDIQHKLEAFITKYYVNRLLKGIILFVSLGLIYFLLIAFIEYMLWLDVTSRTVLFWCFVAVEIVLFFKFIVVPILKLTKISKGLTYADASLIIGKHFDEVDDKLINVLQLYESGEHTDLILASIEQKSAELKPIPFNFAINFKSNIKYLKYLLVPVVIFLISFFVDNNWYIKSYNRISDYKTVYVQPAPFKFVVSNSSLDAIEFEDFMLRVKVIGKSVPNDVQINYNNQTYFLTKTGEGTFEYLFTNVRKAIKFDLFSGKFSSSSYQLNFIKKPKLLDFELFIDYPSYTNKKDEVIKNSGNAFVPEGSNITWKMYTKSTSLVTLFDADTSYNFNANQSIFSLKKQILNEYNYSITTSNAKLKNFDALYYSIKVLKDEYPDISVEMKTDSLQTNTKHFKGVISDDYGFTNLKLYYYPIDNPVDINSVSIPVDNRNFSEFFYTFPNNVSLIKGVAYELYFKITDNDQINNYKSASSKVFTFNNYTQADLNTQRLNQQNDAINSLSTSFEKLKNSKSDLEKLAQLQKEKKALNFNDKKALDNFLKRQKQQDQILKDFSKKLKQTLQNNVDKSNTFKDDLKKRIEENLEQLKKDDLLRKELKKIADKLDKSQITKKLDELGKQQKNKKKSLQQLIELSRRFYVIQQKQKLSEEFLLLSQEQNEMVKKSNGTFNLVNHDTITQKFTRLNKDLSNLKIENSKLYKPIKIPNTRSVSDAITTHLNAISKDGKLVVSGVNKAKQKLLINEIIKNQNKSTQKLRKLSNALKNSSAGGGGGGSKEEISEDIDMLRQILDNLLLFSFDQEELMTTFKKVKDNGNNYATLLRRQKDLKQHFKHVDDSLFSLSLRQPKISEKVYAAITDVYFNMDKALSHFAENNTYNGVSNQQYTISHANELASMLSDMLDNLNNELSIGNSGGDGKPSDSIPDIIISQEQLKKQFQKEKSESEDGQSGSDSQPLIIGKSNGDGKGKGKGSSDEKGDSEKSNSSENTSGTPKSDAQKGSQGENSNGKKGKNGASSGEGEGNGKGNGKDGAKDGNGGTGTSKNSNLENYKKQSTESLNSKLFSIYKKQVELRQALEDKLREQGLPELDQNLKRAFDDVEDNLLNTGFSNKSLQKLNNLQHQLLKLKKATLEQNKDANRSSNVNTKSFINDTDSDLPKARNYFSTNEILNRQALPLQPIYKSKINDYFKSNND